VDAVVPVAETGKRSKGSTVQTAPTPCSVKTSIGNLSTGREIEFVLQEAKPEVLIASSSSIVAAREFAVHGDDRKMPSCLSLFDIRRNEGRIYSALVKIAINEGMGSGEETWSIRVGYKALHTASGCNARTLGRAWPRLLEWGFLERILEHHNRCCKTYFVRSVLRVDAIYKGKGYTYFRVLKGELLPFRPKPRNSQGAR